MLNLTWNATLNRLGAGAVAFYVGTMLPRGTNYLSFLGMPASASPTNALLEGLIFVICSYFLGSIFVGVGRRKIFAIKEISWREEVVLAAHSENAFLQGVLTSQMDRSDAFAGLGIALLIFAPLFIVYILMGEIAVAMWLSSAGIAALGLLKMARDEANEGKRLILHFKEMESKK
jgi:hypothetical protein